MEHRTISTLRRLDELHAAAPAATPLSRRERLERWAALLEADPRRRLVTFDTTEFLDRPTREALRRDNSMVALAWNDPVLRADGLADDSHGTAQRYFGLSDSQMHHIVCQCHHGTRAFAADVAARVRMAIPEPTRPGLLTRVWRWLTA